MRIRLRKSFIGQVCLSCVRSLQYRKYLVFIATVTNFCHTVALFRYEQVLKKFIVTSTRDIRVDYETLLQVQKHSRLERTSARQVTYKSTFHTQWEFKVLYINMIKNSNQRHDQHARPAEPYKCATYNDHCNNIITASMIVSDIYAIMNFYSELTSGGQISELILLY